MKICDCINQLNLEHILVVSWIDRIIKNRQAVQKTLFSVLEYVILNFCQSERTSEYIIWCEVSIRIEMTINI